MWMIVCCRQCAKEALKDLCHWLHHGGEVAVCPVLFTLFAQLMMSLLAMKYYELKQLVIQILLSLWFRRSTYIAVFSY